MKKDDFKNAFYARAYRYAIEIINFVEKIQRNDNAGQIIGKQLLRSGTSVTANLVEAKSASSKKDYINFYTHSLKSANESKLWIGLLRDTKKANHTESEKILKETGELANILAASIITMKNKR
jgi:four helix bundle protein